MKIMKFAIFMVFSVFLCLSTFLYSAYSWASEMSAPANTGIKHELTVDKGDSTKQIAIKLKSKKTIKSAFLFRIYVRFLGVDNKLRPGVYSFTGTETLGQVIHKIMKGNEPSVTVTIPEGTTIKQIADILSEAKICESAKFQEICSDSNLVAKVFCEWSNIPETAEGLLFPDTYNFSKDTPAEQVATAMMRLTKTKLSEIFIKPLPQNLTPYEGCILASIIEKEAAIAAERPVIASVFYNRLKKKQKLESCATVLYALGIHKGRLTNKDLKIESPYNTYKIPALPPSPISNFGADSLKAVANPADTNYLYFVSDNNRGHTFAVSLKDHSKNKQQFFKKRKQK